MAYEVPGKILLTGPFYRANANNSKICFWLVSHILFDTILLEVVRKEVAPSISNGKIDIQYIINQCQLLDASFNEILRLATGASSARSVTETTTIGDKTLCAGAKILVPYRQLHYDEQFFGPDINTFNPYRFFDNKDLHKSLVFQTVWGWHDAMFSTFSCEERDLGADGGDVDAIRFGGA